MKAFKLIAAVFASATLVACVPQSEKNDGQNPRHGLTENEVHVLVTNAKVRATVPINSPDFKKAASVAYLLAAVPEGSLFQLFQCTAFLVAPDIVATDAHCLKSESQRVGMLGVQKNQPCPRVHLIFPSLGDYVQEKVDCVEILYSRGGDKEWSHYPDFAFLRLKREVNRPILPIQVDEWSRDEDQVTVISINPGHERLLNGVLEIQKCSYRSRSFMNSNSYTLFLSDCQFIPGNSGSPVFANQNRIRGILQSSVYGNYLSGLNESLKNFGAAELTPMGGFTPAECWGGLVAPNFKLPSEDFACPALAPRQALALAPVRTQIRSLFKSEFVRTNSQFIFDARVIAAGPNMSATVGLAPFCKKSGTSGTIESPTETSFWLMQWTTNEYGELLVKKKAWNLLNPFEQTVHLIGPQNVEVFWTTAASKSENVKQSYPLSDCSLTQGQIPQDEFIDLVPLLPHPQFSQNL